MADSTQATTNSIIPISGSYLSAQNRKKIFNRSGVSLLDSSNAGRFIPIKNSRNIETLANRVNSDSFALNSLQKQVADLNERNIQLVSSLSAVNVLQNQINVLRSSINNLGSTLQEIGVLINTDSQLEIQKERQEIDTERRLSQRSIRDGKESELEKKIQASLLTPVQEVSGRVQDTLGSLFGFFGALFTGWLTNQGIEALRASFNDNKRKLNDIKNSTISNLTVIGGIFSAFRFGINGIISTIARLSFRVGNLVVGNTIGSIFGNLLKLIPGLPTPPTINPGAKPSGKPAGGFGTLFGTAMEAFQGNAMEAILGGASFLPGFPGAIAKGAFWGEQLLDVFGKGVIPEGEMKLPDIQTMYSMPTTILKSIQPIQLPDFKNLFKSSDDSNQKVESSSSSSISSQQISQSFNIKPQISLSPQISDITFSPDSMFAANSVANYKSENMIDFSKAPLYGRVKINVENGENINQNDVPNLASIQSKRISTIPFDIKPEPEPKPTVIYKKSTTKQSGSGSVPLKTGSATNVPIIASSNSDNMYTLYSQSSYNVMV